MTERVLPPPGWYSDPELAGHLRWWDGAQWQHRAEAPPRSALGGSFAGLGLALRLLLAAMGLLSVVTIVHALWGHIWVAAELERGEVGLATAYDGLALGLGVAWLGLFVGTGVVWCVWQHRLARAAEPGQVRRSPGMHAGSWFIPVVGLWFPFQNMRDLGRAWRVSWAPGVLGLWWTLWVVLSFTGSALFRVEVDDPESFRTYTVLSAVDAVIWVVTSALALSIVSALTRAALLRSRSAEVETPGFRP